MSNPLYLSDWIYYRSSIGREAKRKEDFIRSKVSEVGQCGEEESVCVSVSE